MSIIQGTSKAAGGGYTIDQSIRFNQDDAAYLYRDVTSAPTDGKKFTYSVWIKRGAIGSSSNCGLLSGGSGTSAGRCDLIFTAGAATGDGSNYDALKFDIYSGGFDQTRSLAKLRDPSSWYHIVFVFDAANATANDTMIMYLNGERLELDSTSGVPNVAALVNANGQRTRVGADASGTPVEFDGYMAEINMIDGQALDPTSFGETNDDGVWVPKAYTGSYGTNGFYITGETASDLGEDFSGNNNDFTSTGLATTDQMLDTPTNNFCTLNPVEPNWGGAVTLSDGNLALAGTAATVWNNAVATFKTLPSTGKWIWASEPNTSGAGRGDPWIVNETGLASRNNYVYVNANGWEAAFDTSSVHSVLNNGSGTNASFTYGSGDFHVICFDADSKKLWFGVYDVSTSTLQFRDGSTGFTGDPGAGTNPTFTLTGNEFSIGFATYTGRSGVVDFGQSNLLSQFTAPTGFQTLCTANLPDPTIADPSAYFQTLAYASTGTSTAFVQDGNSQFEPGLVWVKSRTGANNHLWFDQVRGATKFIRSDTTNAENTVADTLTAFNSNGFTAGADASNWGINYPGRNNVAWQWAADGTSGSSNTDGSITSTVSANTTSGFSIVKYAGNLSTTGSATVGHGLGTAPLLVISKSLDSTAGDSGGWSVQHTSLAASNILRLNTTAATSSKSANGTLLSPTSTVFYTNFTEGMNVTGNDYIAYCFAEVEGFSKFGSYTGNGSSDGPFIYTGFRPAFVLWKNASTSGTDWYIKDTARDTYNVMTKRIYPNAYYVEDPNTSNDLIDTLSNGFKIRSSANAATNGSGNTIIYAAFASSPFKTATAR